MTKLFSFAKINTILVAILLSSIAVFVFFISSVSAVSVPQYMSYQGQLFDSADDPVDDTVSIEFTIYDALSGGTELWSETQTVTVDSGYFAVTLGSVTPLDLDWDSRYFITLNIDSDGEMSPRQPINTSAYSFAADVAYRALASSTAPASSVTGSLYYNTTSNTLAVYTGSDWINLPTSTSVGAGDVIASADNTFTGSNSFTGTTTLATTTITAGTIATLSATTASVSGTVTLSATTTVSGPALLGSYLQFTTNGNNHLYFDNGTSNRISWNDSLDTFEITNDLEVTGTVTSTAVVATSGTIGALTVTSTVSFPNNSITDAMIPDTITASNYLLIANNLSDITNTSTARTNLGLGSIATANVSEYLQSANNLSDLVSTSTARTNLGLGTIATESANSYLAVSNNLSDLSNTSTARTNLGFSGGTGITISGAGVIGLTSSNISQFTNDAGYLTAAPAESDPIWTAASSSYLTTASAASTYLTLASSSVSNWDTAFSWGDHANAGYLTTSTALTVSNFASPNISQWTNDAGYLTSLSGALLIANNLSDLTNTSTARTNLGLGTIATAAASDYVSITGGTLTGTLIGTTVSSTVGTFDSASANSLTVSGTNTSTFAGSINLPAGYCFAVDGTCLTGGGGGGSGTVNSGTSGYLAYYPSTGTTVDDSGVYWSGTALGLSDATPDYLLDVAGTLGIDGALTIGDASTDTVTANAAAWTFANDTTIALTGGVDGLNFDSNTLSIDATNNRIGIGTAAPSYALHVASGASVVGYMSSSGSTGRLGINSTANTGFGLYISDVLKWTNAATQVDVGNIDYVFYNDQTAGTAMVIDGTSNSLGIGDTTPDYLLDVAGTAGFDGNVTIGTGTEDAVTSNADAWTFANDTTITLTGGLNGLNFDSNTLSIDAANDRIGIGTASPGATLQVMGSVTSDQVRIGTASDGFHFKIGRNTSTGHLQFEGSQGGTVSGYAFVNGSSPFLITGTGNVGIGDSTPTALLTVGSGDLFQVNSSGAIAAVTGITNSGNITIHGNSQFGNASTDTVTAYAAAWTFISDTTVALNGAENGLNFDNNTLSIDAANNRIGIGTAAPSYTLHVIGSGDNVAKFENNASGTACTLSGTTGILSCTSDARLKKDIIPLDTALSRIMSLTPASFHWLNQSDIDALSTGFIAQEVEVIFPDLVQTDTETGYKSLSTIGLVPYLTKAIQEQQIQITALADAIGQGGDTEVLNGHFEGTLRVKKSVAFGADTVGQVKILAGSVAGKVTFSEAYEYMPIVAVTPVGSELLAYDFSFVVTDKTAEGFTVQISQPQPIDITFDWHAFAAEQGKLFVSDGTIEDIELVVIDEPIWAEVVVEESGSGGSSEGGAVPPEEEVAELPVSEAPVEEVGGETETPAPEEVAAVEEPVVEESVVPEPETAPTEPVSSETPAADSVPSEAGETVL